MATVGRKPRKLTDKDIEQVKSMAGIGCTDKQIFDALGVSRDYFYKKKRELKEFNDAILQARANGIAKIANVHFKAAMEGDVKAMQFVLSRKGGWIEAHLDKQGDSEILAEAINGLVGKLTGA